MRSRQDLDLVTHLADDGLNDCEIERRTGIPRSTVRRWRATERRGTTGSCDLCGHADHDHLSLPAEDYAYLLGLYLGDGHIVHQHRGVFRLSVFLDRRYPGIVQACGRAMDAVIGATPYLQHDDGFVTVSTYSKSWPCLIPQHGSGRKHERRITLKDWQKQIIGNEREALLRGLVHSDGWRGTNRVVVNGRAYTYPRYQFSNVSDDIRAIFTGSLDALGVEWRRMNTLNISVAKRASVARLDEFIGLKR